jgi:hypothetical protein
MRKNQFDKCMTLILQWNDIVRIFWVNENTQCMISDFPLRREAIHTLINPMV